MRRLSPRPNTFGSATNSQTTWWPSLVNGSALSAFACTSSHRPILLQGESSGWVIRFTHGNLRLILNEKRHQSRLPSTVTIVGSPPFHTPSPSIFSPQRLAVPLPGISYGGLNESVIGKLNRQSIVKIDFKFMQKTCNKFHHLRFLLAFAEEIDLPITPNHLSGS